MSQYKFLKRVVVEPKHPLKPTAVTVEMSDDERPLDFWSPCPRSATIRANLDATTIRYEFDWTDDYKRVAAVVGHNHAGAVLDALKKPVPDDWDTAA